MCSRGRTASDVERVVSRLAAGLLYYDDASVFGFRCTCKNTASFRALSGLDEVVTVLNHEQWHGTDVVVLVACPRCLAQA